MRKVLLQILLVPLCTMCCICASAGQIIHMVTYDPSKLTISYDTLENNVYARVNYDNCFSCNTEGEPELPNDNLLISVPYNAVNFNVHAQVNNYTDTLISSLVYPAQASRELDDTTTFFSPPKITVYGSTSFYPSNNCQIVSSGYIYGDNKVVLAQLLPISYNPATSTLRLATSITLTLEYDIDISIVPFISRNNSYIKEIEMSMVAQDVINGTSVMANSYVPNETHSVSGQNLTHLPTYNYCIITNRELEPAFKKIIAMKRQKGLSAGVVCLEDLMASPICNDGDCQNGSFPTIADSAGVVRQYLKYAFRASSNPVQYVLMGGKAPFSPIRYSFSKNLINNKNSFHTPTDMYFSNLSLPWVYLSSIFDEMNESGYYVPSSVMENNVIPYFPDIFVGRLLCSNQDEINNYSDKLYRYIFNPGYGDSDYLTNAFILSSGQVYDMEKIILSYLNDNNLFNNVEYIKNKGINYLSGAQAIEYINLNPIGYLSLYAHGEPQALAIYDGAEKRIITALDSNHATDSVCDVIEETRNGLDNLTNKLYPNVCYSISCVTMPYDRAQPFYSYTTNEGKWNLGSSYVLGKNYGGPAYLGNTRKGYGNLSEYLEKDFLKSIFDRSLFSVGKAEAFSKVHFRTATDSNYNHVIIEHNLLGDPEFEMWTEIPQHYNNITVQRNNNQVIINGVNAIDTIGYYSNDGFYGRLFGQSGRVIINHPNCHIMIYRHNYLPYIAYMKLENCEIINSQYVYATDMDIVNNVVFKNGTEYIIDATGNILIGNGCIVENGAAFAVKTPGKVTIDGCVFQSGAKVKIESGKVEFVGKFTAELGSKVEFTQFVDD